MADGRTRAVDNVSTRSQLPAPFADSTQSDLDSGRLHLSTAFRYSLIVLPFPAVSWLLWSGNFRGSYYQHDDRPRLCDFTPQHCDTLVSFPMFVMPTTGVFAFIFLLVLDHFLVVSPIFGPSQGPSTAIQTGLEGEHRANNQASGDDLGRRRHHAHTILRFCIVVAWICSAVCTFCFLVATANASLVLRLDSPFEKDRWDDKVIFVTRVILGYGEAISDALLAYCMGRAALTLSRARRAIGPRDGVGGAGQMLFWARLSGAWSRVIEGYWHQRAVLDKAVVCLVSALALSFVSAIICLEHEPFAYLTSFNLLSCFLTVVFVWPALLSLHDYSSSNMHVRKIPRIVIPTFLLLLASFWVSTSSAYIFEYVRALLCPWYPDLPSCSYVRYHSIWAAAVVGLAGYMQAWSLGGAAVLIWRAGGAVYLE